MTEIIHFVFTLPERIACAPNLTELYSTAYHPHYQRTSEPSAVTCPDCRDSNEYKEAVKSIIPGYSMHGLQRK